MNIEEEEIKIVKRAFLICPQCSETVINLQNSSEAESSIINMEFNSIICKKCETKFCFILCAYCENFIYMKIHPKAAKYNGLNGFNIKCPYKSCEKEFYFSECFKCHRSQKIKNYFKEGDIITCTYEDCKCKYIQFYCPVKECIDVQSIEKPIEYKNFPEGVLLLHKKEGEKEALFQKINCFYCWRPIVFRSEKSKKNKYWECQKVTCPYKNCKKIFNRIICPFCFKEIFVNEGWYEMGSKIRCQNCKNNFSKLICPSCCKINVCKNDHFTLGYVICGFKNCLNHNYMINCIFCRKINIFKKKIPIKGQIIKCGYCQKTFNEISCPFCKLKNPFPLSDFCFGKVYKCAYLSCMKEFQFLVCPNCFGCLFISETKEGKKRKCNQCNTVFMNWGCPFCCSSILDKNSCLKLGQLVKCPLKKCEKVYSFVQCSICDKLIFSRENESILGTSIKCNHPGCGAYTLAINCPKCHAKIMYKGERNNLIEGEQISCSNCGEKFRFKKNNEIYNNELIILEEIVGGTINFGIEDVDENFLMKEDLFLDKGCKKSTLYPTQFTSSNYSINSSIDIAIDGENEQKINLGECIVCHNHLKESIFYPCGHRCTCYNCAVIVFTVNKKCPKCNKEAKCIIRKIYE